METKDKGRLLKHQVMGNWWKQSGKNQQSHIDGGKDV